jgi:hypothetical protein
MRADPALHASLGAYEILALIGAGGMGESYRARHTPGYIGDITPLTFPIEALYSPL